MGRFVLLLRGINVGGVVLKMDDLRRMLSSLRYTDIKTYIQSGNAVFDSSHGEPRALEDEIKGKIKAESGLDVAVIVKTEEEFRRIASSHPFRARGEKKHLYVTLLHDTPQRQNRKTLLEYNGAEEEFELTDAAVYTYYGAGYGASAFSNNYIESKLKVAATTRNWNTMQKILELLDE